MATFGEDNIIVKEKVVISSSNNADDDTAITDGVEDVTGEKDEENAGTNTECVESAHNYPTWPNDGKNIVEDNWGKTYKEYVNSRCARKLHWKAEPGGELYHNSFDFTQLEITSDTTFIAVFVDEEVDVFIEVDNTSISPNGEEVVINYWAMSGFETILDYLVLDFQGFDDFEIVDGPNEVYDEKEDKRFNQVIIKINPNPDEKEREIFVKAVYNGNEESETVKIVQEFGVPSLYLENKTVNLTYEASEVEFWLKPMRAGELTKEQMLGQFPMDLTAKEEDKEDLSLESLTESDEQYDGLIKVLQNLGTEKRTYKIQFSWNSLEGETIVPYKDCQGTLTIVQGANYQVAVYITCEITEIPQEGMDNVIIEYWYEINDTAKCDGIELIDVDSQHKDNYTIKTTEEVEVEVDGVIQKRMRATLKFKPNTEGDDIVYKFKAKFNGEESEEITITQKLLIEVDEKYGSEKLPVILFSGVVKRNNRSTPMVWSWTGSLLEGILVGGITTDKGLLKLNLKPDTSILSSVIVTSAHATQYISGDLEDITKTSHGGSNSGAHWFEVRPLPNGNGYDINVREIHKTNSNNESWATNNWEENMGSIYGVDITVFGYAIK